MMYIVKDLEAYLGRINLKRAKEGDKPIKQKKWSAYIPDTAQSWFDANLPSGKGQKILGMDNHAKILDLYAAVNGCLKSHGLGFIPETAIIEIA